MSPTACSNPAKPSTRLCMGLDSDNSIYWTERRAAQYPAECAALFCPHAISRLLWILDHLEMVRDVLGIPRGAPRGGPPDGVRTRTQRSDEQIVSLLGTRTQEQLGYFRHVVRQQISRWQLHVENRRLAAGGAGEVPGRFRNP